MRAVQRAKVAMGKSASTFESLQRLVAELPCPNCLKFQLEFLLRCDLGYRECLRVARCNACGHALVLDSGFENTLAEVVRRKARPCPECGSVETRLALVCELTSHRPLAVGFCDSCGANFSLG